MLSFTSSLMATTVWKNLPAKTLASTDNSAVHPRAVLDGDRFPSSCKKYGHWCRFIFLDPNGNRRIWRKERKWLVGCRNKNYPPFIQQKLVFKVNELWDFSGTRSSQDPKGSSVYKEILVQGELPKSWEQCDWAQRWTWSVTDLYGDAMFEREFIAFSQFVIWWYVHEENF